MLIVYEPGDQQMVPRGEEREFGRVGVRTGDHSFGLLAQEGKLFVGTHDGGDIVVLLREQLS